MDFHSLESAVMNKVRPVFVPPTPLTRAPDIGTISGETLELIKQLGEVTLVPLSNGRQSSSILLCEDQLQAFFAVPNLKAYLEGTVFAGPDCPNNKTYQVRTNGTLKIMVDMDLYQQKALLKAIVAKAPQLRTVLGFYNLKASRKVHDVYKNKPFVGNANDKIWWIWLAEVFNPAHGNANDPVAEAKYPDDGIITLENSNPDYQMQDFAPDKRFVLRYIVNGDWRGNDPQNHDDLGGGLLGVLHG